MDLILNALKALAEPTRMRLIALCAQGDLTVTDLVTILGQSQPRISRHLKLLCEAGLLQRLREGSWVFHRLSTEPNHKELLSRLLGLIPHEDETLLRDRERLDELKFERNKQATLYFSENAQRWAEIRSLHADENLVDQTLLDILKPSSKDEYLDMGSGTGQLLIKMADHIAQGWGIDLSSDMLSVARTRLEEHKIDHCAVRQGDIYQVPFGSETFSIVSIYQVLHFAEDPMRALREAFRVLKPNGQLAIVDFAPHEEESLRIDHQHRRLGFRDAEIQSLFLNTGFKELTQKTIPGDPLTVCIWVAKKP